MQGPSEARHSGLLRSGLPGLVLLRELDYLAADRVVAAQGVADPVVGHQDPRELGVSVEDDSEHVVGLALVPVGRWEQVVRRGDMRWVAVDERTDPQLFAA